ncbi:DUF4265 domain-containing protein [Alteromonas aestuariivivens]|uniref:DUF4265 domain-containing protein n=1 Tax=Alteromonas aestuariivivens TaxID=1938339 RepID=A0A3D8MAT1_9ALTE|nr:DUF4265 domain-containing protein [Alteromonas aestuariivivens]RDV27358.1 DUF4265 domain-containing protein [Alteromonas aestuariivivens]
MSNEGLVKVHVSLPNHWMIGGESMWAEPLGNDIYRLENVPFFSYSLNFKDEVKAYSDDDGVLEITDVVARSGNRTLRIIFDKSIDRQKQEYYIEQIRDLDCSLERWDETYLAINVRKSAHYLDVIDHFDIWNEKDILAYETCDEQIPGSFDAEPDEGA